MKKIVVLLVLLMPVFAYAGADFKEGVEYLKLTNPQPTADADKIEVLEAFWYGCPHCYRFEPEIHAWREKKPDDVAFVRLPVIFHPSWEPHARAYYTAQIMEVLDKVHQPLFDQVHKQRQRVHSVKDVKRVFLAQGISGHEFDKIYNSFAVITKTNRAKQAGDLYSLKGVPTLVV
ncbi:Periplasmic thiol:disulfide interchange protein DsbA, partial [hydrothermal vent metagenome]